MGRVTLLTLIVAGIAHAADWSALEPRQRAVTRVEFNRLLTEVYCPSGALTNYLAYSTNSVTVFSTPAKTNALFTLQFAPSEISRLQSQIHRIALDPGHIGGDWAAFEERRFVRDEDKPVEEAVLNLTVARLLKTRLETAGLEVVLTKNDLEPVTDKRPPVARADIAARARKINEELKPDLTVCLHFNAAPWNERHDLVDENRLTVFIHGNYLPDELDDDEQKFCLLAKLLERSHATELAVADAIATALAKATGLDPLPASENAVPVSDNAHLLARNLAANRLFHGPVIYLEPYYMNNRIVYQRIQAGDYDDTRKIEGKHYPSIFREYADAVAAGLLNFLGTAPRDGQSGSRR